MNSSGPPRASPPPAQPDDVPSQLSVIVTTSPTPSAPSTALLSWVLRSFREHCAVLLACRLIVVLDTFDHIGPKNQLKKGVLTADGAATYDLYKDNVKALVLGAYEEPATGLLKREEQAEYGSPLDDTNSVTLDVSTAASGRVTFIEPRKRIGFGLAVRSALRLVDTPYVWVQQHDWPLVADIPLPSLLRIMTTFDADEQTPVKYVCLPSVGLLSYATSEDVVLFPELRALTATLKSDDLLATHRPAESSSSTLPPHGIDTEHVPIPLTPLFLWHDKPHIVSTAHYLGRVYRSRLAMRRGNFTEDHIGQIARTQMKSGRWARWATWLYYPEDGRRKCVYHLDGRRWRGVDGELKAKLENQAARGYRGPRAMDTGTSGLVEEEADDST